MQSTESKDRRQHPRHRTLRVEVKVATPELLHASTLRDVSTGGLFVRSQRPLAVKTRVVVELVHEGQVLRLPGTVVRVEERGYGVQFDPLEAAQVGALTQLIISSAEAAQKAEPSSEAYEEAMARLREAEHEATQRAELAEFERAVVVERMNELQQKLDVALREGPALRSALKATASRLEKLEAERAERRAKELELTAELAADEERVEVLEALLAQRTAEWTSTQQALEAELAAVTTTLSSPDVDQLRDEVRSLTAALDEERLKAMSLERALERFRLLGGTTSEPAPAPKRN